MILLFTQITRGQRLLFPTMNMLESAVDLYTGNTENDEIIFLKIHIDLYMRSTYTQVYMVCIVAEMGFPPLEIVTKNQKCLKKTHVISAIPIE